MYGFASIHLGSCTSVFFEPRVLTPSYVERPTGPSHDQRHLVQVFVKGSEGIPNHLQEPLPPKKNMVKYLCYKKVLRLCKDFHKTNTVCHQFLGFDSHCWDHLRRNSHKKTPLDWTSQIVDDIVCQGATTMFSPHSQGYKYNILSYMDVYIYVIYSIYSYAEHGYNP